MRSSFSVLFSLLPSRTCLQKRLLNSRLAAQSTTTMTTDKHNQNPIAVHSTFRNYDGQLVRPHGLEWHMDGDSFV